MALSQQQRAKYQKSSFAAATKRTSSTHRRRKQPVPFRTRAVKLEVPCKIWFRRILFKLAQRVRAQAPQNRRSLRDNRRVACEPRKAGQLRVTGVRARTGFFDCRSMRQRSDTSCTASLFQPYTIRQVVVGSPFLQTTY